jgi:hypothetical protein
MERTAAGLAHRVLDRYGQTFADEAGIALAAAHELNAAGWTTAQRLRDAPRPRVVAALGRAGYRRYDERTATQLREMGALVLDRYGGDLRRLAEAAAGDVAAAGRLIQEVRGIGPTGAAVFLREVQAVWPWVRPYLDDRARSGAGRLGLPDDDRLAELVEADDLARFAAALVRVSRLPTGEDPGGD